MPNPFNELNRDNPTVVKHELRRAYEHAKVQFMLKQLGLSKRKRQLVEWIARNDEDTRLTFTAFNEVFSSFPVWVTGTNLGDLSDALHLHQKATLPNWFKTFTSLPFIKHYTEAYAAAGNLATEKPVGLVFPRKGFKQGLIVHNGDWQTFVPPKSSCHLYVGGGNRKQTVLLVQPFSTFLTHVYRNGRGWKPEEICEI